MLNSDPYVPPHMSLACLIEPPGIGNHQKPHDHLPHSNRLTVFGFRILGLRVRDFRVAGLRF